MVRDHENDIKYLKQKVEKIDEKLDKFADKTDVQNQKIIELLNERNS